MSDLLTRYRQHAHQQQWNIDRSQQQLIEQLQQLHSDIKKWQSPWAKLPFIGHQRPHGLYIYGDVGAGKSMAMDLFFEHLPKLPKRRIHFHAFMREVHEHLHHLRAEKITDPLTQVAKRMVKRGSVLCFDEFFVNDIADAMILQRLFEAIWQRDVVVVATSNTMPQKLYEHGLQRENFMPFITILQRHCHVFHLQSERDYRYSKAQGEQQRYYVTNPKKGAMWLQSQFTDLTEQKKGQARELDIKGHKLKLKQCHQMIAWTDFDTLCQQPRTAADFLALVTEFDTVLLESIPALSPDQRDITRRFITLIDVLYEHRIRLIATASVPFEDIYSKGQEKKAFNRTISRLQEMQSGAYP